MVRALLIDDDARLPQLLTEYLGQFDISLTSAKDGPTGLKLLDSDAFDVVLLDLMLPGIDGLEVCRRIRKKSAIPILMLTAKGDETDRVVGLELGADDYLPKPFGPRELVARIKAILRRGSGAVSHDKLTFHDLEVDVSGRRATVAGSMIELTAVEFDILATLLRRIGRVVARDTLLSESGRGDVMVSERTIDVHVAHLRQKVGKKFSGHIRTVRGAGYVFATESE